jgi:hypothetical protein
MKKVISISLISSLFTSQMAFAVCCDMDGYSYAKVADSNAADAAPSQADLDQDPVIKSNEDLNILVDTAYKYLPAAKELSKEDRDQTLADLRNYLVNAEVILDGKEDSNSNSKITNLVTGGFSVLALISSLGKYAQYKNLLALSDSPSKILETKHSSLLLLALSLATAAMSAGGEFHRRNYTLPEIARLKKIVHTLEIKVESVRLTNEAVEEMN